MGNTSQRSSRNSKLQTRMDDQELRRIARKIDEKENICIAMQNDIDLAILQGNTKNIELLKNEIDANLIDLNQVFQIRNIPRGHLRKATIVKHNFETNLGKLKSLEKNSTENSSSGNPDLVKDLIGVDVEPSCSLPENKLKAVADELAALKDCFARSCNDYDIYCVLDKGGFYLQADLRNIEIPTTSPLYQRKQDLTEELLAFRDSVSRRFAEIQEQHNFITSLDTLFVELNEATNKHDFEVVHKKALALRDQMPTSQWGSGLSSSRETVLKKLIEIEQSTLSLRDKYPQRSSLESNSECFQIEGHSNDSSTDIEENLYSNFDVFKQHQFGTSANDVLQNLTRRTIYANEDAIQNMDFFRHNVSEVEIKKRPLPLPRNSEDTVINNLPRYWQKLNEILLADSSDETSRNEVDHIQKQIETARKLFEKKMELVLNKFEEAVEL